MYSQTIPKSAFSPQFQYPLSHQSQPAAFCYQPYRLQPDFKQLQQFQPVGDRWQKLGLVFEGAIALYPSNPRYYDQTAPLVIMPLEEQGNISIQLHRPFSQIKVRVRSLGEVSLTALDSCGHCIAHGYTRELSQTSPSSPTIGSAWLGVTASQMASLVLSARAPFVVEAVRLA